MLLAFNLGELPEAVLESIREHQESCFRCELRARQLDDQTDLVIETLRRAMTQPTGKVGARSSGTLENGTELVHLVEGWCLVQSDRDEGSDDPSEPSMAGRHGDSHGSLSTECAERKPPVLPDYEVGESLIGRGSTGVVYKARHLKLNRIVALKMIAGTSSKVSAIFEIEAKAVARLQHPNIVQIFDIGTHEGQPFLALEFVDGGSLDQKIAGRPQPPHFAAEMVRTLAMAADYAHRQGIVHCDLKPSNILITPEGVPKIADFGVAKWLESDDQWSQDGDILGTPRYMAPEQAIGSVQCVGPMTDVYSLGVILYEMLIGRPPHYSSTSFETLTLVCEQEPVPPRQLQPKLSRDLETIALKCLRKEPAKRYSDARALAEDLERFLTGLPILARPINTVERACVWVKRHRMACSLTIITALWLATCGLLAWRYHAMLRLYHTVLSSVSPMESNAQLGKPLMTIPQAADGSIHLRGSMAAISGDTLALEAHFGNLGYWHSDNDRAVWTFRVDRPATFTVSLDYACQDASAGNRYEIRVGDDVIRGMTVGTGAWSNYRSFLIGELNIPAGIHRLEVRLTDQVRTALFDLLAITLKPQ
jgi:serine/threonine protein kinase